MDLAMAVCTDTYAPKEPHVTTSNWGNANFKLVGFQSCYGTALLDHVLIAGMHST